MSVRFSKYVPAVLVVAMLATTGCSNDNPAAVTAPTAAQPLSLTAEPASVSPEFLPRGHCSEAPGFRTRFVVIVSGMERASVQGLHVSFIDRFGVSAVPTVFPASGISGSSMNTPPIQLPSSMPIPIPTSGPNNGLSVPAGHSARVPVTLEFGCNVRARGTIVVDADTRDERGRSGKRRLTVEVGE
jgi:hypothetical protein